MAGPTFDWTRLGNEGEVRKVVRRAVKDTVTTPLEDKHAFVPYQYTLGVMCGLYHLLQTDVPRERGRASIQDPESIRLAKEVPLRAIAYFSWEAERHEFLIRRVYPRYFDFISYSSVPVPWGALGVMYDKYRGAEYPGYTVVDDVSAEQRLLPYLREIHRLKYGSVIVVPVYRGRRQGGELGGALAFYGIHLTPPKGTEFSDHVRNVSSELSRAAKIHEDGLQKLGLGPQDERPPGHAEILAKEARTHSFDVYELVVEFIKRSGSERLESGVAQLRGELTALNLFCHRDTRQKGSSVRFLVVPNKAISQELVMRHIHASVGITFPDSDIRRWRCEKLGPASS